MRWQSSRRSDNVEDRRGMRPSRAVGLGGLGILAIAGVALLLGANPRQIMQVLLQVQDSQPSFGSEARPESAAPGGYDEQADFVSAILASTEDAWREQFANLGRRYEPPRLVLFSGTVDSACGFSSSATGPFYCPSDSKVYLDLSFFNELDRRFGTPGDFARAYVVAHEIGHHVQNLLGTLDEVHALQRQAPETESNALSVQLELHADCLAGVWAHYANAQRQLLEPGDLEEGLAAAAAVGDDAIQRSAGRRVNPESWTHGSAEQRSRSFRHGLNSGDIESCGRLAL
ncbi:MAG: neutral zinc metallopeptidase [Vicinamibacteria bacterium]|nr:neutral zinc metallopeptidase [Vicinamibacteria bacterium]